MIVYLAGPMTGHPDFNSLAFVEAAAYAVDRGWKPVSPQTTDPTHSGACLERGVAEACGMPIHYVPVEEHAR